MKNQLPPPADMDVVKLELIRIKIILENPNKLRVASDRKKKKDM